MEGKAAAGGSHRRLHSPQGQVVRPADKKIALEQVLVGLQPAAEDRVL